MKNLTSNKQFLGEIFVNLLNNSGGDMNILLFIKIKRKAIAKLFALFVDAKKVKLTRFCSKHLPVGKTVFS